jgi:hypothetical protein
VAQLEVKLLDSGKCFPISASNRTGSACHLLHLTVMKRCVVKGEYDRSRPQDLEVAIEEVSVAIEPHFLIGSLNRVTRLISVVMCTWMPLPSIRFRLFVQICHSI